MILQLTEAVQDAFRSDPVPTTPMPTTPMPTTFPTPVTNATTAFPTVSTTTRKGRNKRSPTPQPQQFMEDEPYPEPRAIHQRRKRQSTGLNFTQDQFLLACMNQNACNPVLRASALAIVERYVIIH